MTVFAALLTIGSTQASRPFLELSTKLETSGTITSVYAGSGLGTVRAQIHAITVAFPPPCSLGRST